MDNIPALVHLVAAIVLPLIFAITLHEAAHGWVASKLGDKTALMLGRVTMNPAKHIDPVGTVIVPILMLLLHVVAKTGFIFGWAKPVPVNWQNLKNPRRDMALVALAGPFANLLMALFWAMMAKLSVLFFANPAAHFKMFAAFIRMASTFGILINCILCLLNLLPIPPLDGSRVVSSILPPSMSKAYERIEPFGLWILLALLFTGILGGVLLPLVLQMTLWIRVLFGLG